MLVSVGDVRLFVDVDGAKLVPDGTATASNAMMTMRRPLASAYIANNGTSNSGGELLRLVG
jgi:hypothetical protein